MSTKPKLLDLFCGAGGSAVGYAKAGFDEIVGVDLMPQPNYPFTFVQADALEYLAYHWHEYVAIHASPPCQGYSIMHNLPWLRGREYPLLLLPLLEQLEAIGKPYVVENVMGARKGAKGLTKRGLEAHGLEAGWLCGTMFGRPFYRHRLFAANWLWLALAHPPHQLNSHPHSERYVYGGSVKGLPGDKAGLDVKPRVTTGPSDQQKGRGVSEQIVAIPTQSGNFDPDYRKNHPNPVNTAWRRYHDGALNIREGYEKLPFAYPTLSNWQNGSENGVGMGHAANWKLAAEAMGIDWMNRDELTQAIPPCMTEHIGRQLMALLERGK